METSFLNHGPVTDPALFIGRAAEIEWVAEKLGRTHPEPCNLVGEPRIGKTSLLYLIYKKLIGLPAGASGVYMLLRFSAVAQVDSIAFWRAFLDGLRKECGLPPQDLPRAPFAEVFSAVQAEIERILARNDRLVVLIDNAELMFVGASSSVVGEDLDAPDQSLRALLIRFEGRLSFVLSSLVPLSTLYRDKFRARSPLLNLFHTLQIGLLGEGEALELVQCLCGEGLGQALPEGEARFLLEEAGRHPELLKVAAEYYIDCKKRSADYDSLADLQADVRGDLIYDTRVDWLCGELYRRREGVDGALEALQVIAAGQGQAVLESDRPLARYLERLGLVQRAEVNGERTVVPFAAVFGDWVKKRTAGYRPAASAAAASTPAGLIYTPGQRKVRVGERSIVLSAMEDRLLAYLYARQGRICAVEDLLQDVWGGVKTRSVVEKAINRLRLKLERDPKRPEYLISAYGKGYLLQAGGKPGTATPVR